MFGLGSLVYFNEDAIIVAVQSQAVAAFNPLKQENC